jgi:hypothetical protein
MLILAVFVVTGLLALVGLVIDSGLYYSERRQTQNGADEAALSAAFILFNGGSNTAAHAAADDYAEGNGYAPEQVTYHHPPTSGDHQGDSNYVEVIIEEDPSTLFIHIVVEGGNIVARGVAGIQDIPAEYALIVLDEFQCEGYYEEGQADFTINDGSMMVNSGCYPDGFSKTGQGDLNVDGDIDVSGGSSVSGSGAVSPAPSEVYWTVPDPLAGVTPPARGAATACPSGTTGTAASPVTCLIEGGGPRVLDPGTYYGGLDLRCNCTVTMNAGNYVISGGGFNKSGQVNIVGDEVMIYVTTNPANPAGDGAPLPFDFSGGGAFDVDPITDPLSEYYGMGLWQAEAITADFYLGGTVNGFSGIIYVPGAELDIAGSTTLDGVQVVAESFNVRGNTQVTLNYNPWFEFDVPQVFLVE